MPDRRPTLALIDRNLRPAARPRLRRILLVALALAALWLATLALVVVTEAVAAPAIGALRGKVVAADTGEPLAFADVLLIPADTTLRRAGGLTNADGSFELRAPVGLYTLQSRYLSYAVKRIENVRVSAEGGDPITVSLKPEAIVQEEVVVEARIKQDNEKALLQQRKRAATVGDAVSSEQIRRSPDKDAADVLRRVTGLSVSDGKYVFVRGLGERYSSTEVDGVRLVSPEQNKRVVPLDLLPANLLENVVVQKTYSADRPAEFGGGDVQVRTRDFPDRASFSISVTQSGEEGTTFRDVRSYLGSNKDRFGMGGDFRSMPEVIAYEADDKRLAPRGIDPTQGFPYDTLARFGRSFRNIWSSNLAQALPNGSLVQSYGNEFKLFGRSLGLVQSLSYSRAVDAIEGRIHREYVSFAPKLDYVLDQTTESVQVGGMAALSYRLAPAHSLHARSVYTRSADDETRYEEGFLEDVQEQVRSTRLKYVERSIFTGSFAGKHDLRGLLGSKLDWKLSRSTGTWSQPDRRQTIYQRYVYVDDQDQTQTQWSLSSLGGAGATREYGDQDDRGWGFEGTWSLPMAFGPLGKGKVDLGGSRQEKNRDYYYRRFAFRPAQGDGSAPPESLFQDGRWTGSAQGARVTDITFPDDNYEASQKQTAGFASLDLPIGRRLRAVVGVRVERGEQDVRSYDLFDRATTTSQGELDDVDWLPSANLNWSMTDQVNLRFAASRTISRPDLREMSPSRDFDHAGGFRFFGNPDLERTRLDNWDVRLEAFPGLGEVLAVGGFYKRLYQPIEIVFRPGDQPFLQPFNSERGENLGLELEARASLGRVWRPLQRFFLNANWSVIRSEVELAQTATVLSGATHPLAGQAAHLVNAALQYTSAGGALDVAVLYGRTGDRLKVVGLLQPDVYVAAEDDLDATLNWAMTPRWKVKLGASDLLGTVHRETQGAFEIQRWEDRRGYSVGLTFQP
jgi:outer membrane receptor protein involved in Fe transport